MRLFRTRIRWHNRPIFGLKMHQVGLVSIALVGVIVMVTFLLPRWNRGNASNTANCLPGVLAANEDAASQLAQDHATIRKNLANGTLAPHALARKLRAAAAACASPTPSTTPAPTTTLAPSPTATATPVPTATPAPQPSATPTPGPVSGTLRGIFCVFVCGSQPNNPALDGVMLAYPWSQIEPSEGTFDWVQVEKDMAPWVAANKTVIIRVQTMIPGANPPATPSWVFDAMKAADPAPTEVTTSTRVPIFWRPTYQQKLADFAASMAAKYDGDPRVTAVQGGIGVYSESKPDKLEPAPNALLTTWQKLGYSDGLWQTTLHQLVNIWRNAFVSTQLISAVDRTFVENVPGVTEDGYLQWLRSVNVIPQNDGFRAGTSVSAKWSRGVSVQEQYNSTDKTGSTVKADLDGMIAVPNVRYVLLYGVDVIKGPQSVLDAAAAQVGR